MNSNKFSVGFVNGDKLGRWTGELSVYTANMAKLYRNNGHKVHLFVKNNLPIPNNLKGVYIHFVKVPKVVGLFKLFRYRFDKKLALRDLYKAELLKEVKKVYDKGFINVIDIPEKGGECQSLLDLGIPTTASFHYGKHLDFEFDDYDQSKRLNCALEYDEKQILSSADSYISPSKHISNIYRHNNSISSTDNLFQVNYPFENKFFSNVPDVDREDDTINVLISTRYAKRKGLEDFLMIITRTILSKKYPKNVKFTFVGLENKSFINLLKSNKYYNKNIFYQIYLVRPKFKELYAKSDIFILPSKSESFSYTLAEAIFSKKVVIVASDSGNDELISDGVDGFVFENENYEHLAKILDSILTKPKLREFVANTLSDVTYKRFGYAKIYNSTKKAYLKALKVKGNVEFINK